MSLSLRVMSDLHLEVAGRGAKRGDVPFTLDCDAEDRQRVLVLAGDIDVDRQAAVFAVRYAPDFRAVILVCGNHEFYRNGSPRRLAAKLRDEVSAMGANNVHVLDDSAVDIDGVRFIGATLWTAFDGGDSDAMLEARKHMSDFARIRIGPMRAPYRSPFTPGHAYDLHQGSCAYIESAAFEAYAQGQVPVVVSHHAPVVPAGAPGSKLAHAYGTDLRALIRRAQPALWVYGHTHVAADTEIAGCRTISNPRGYASIASVPEFNPDWIVEVSCVPLAKTQ